MSAADFPLLPWHAEAWTRLQQARATGRLPHALLLAGPQGVGKRAFAEALAWSLYCARPDATGRPCGQCKACTLFRAGTHPDHLVLEPAAAVEREGDAAPAEGEGDTKKKKKPSRIIGIDAIRGYTGGAGLAAQAGGFKVTLIAPADAMNTAAANALLKTLEEPVRWTLILLITHHPERLPATIRSRCQVVGLGAPAAAEGVAWLRSQGAKGDPNLLLALAAGAPLAALGLEQDGHSLAQRDEALGGFIEVLRGRDMIGWCERWKDPETMSRLLHWMCGWTIDMLRLQISPTPPRLYNPDRREALAGLAARLDRRRLFGLLERLYEARRQADSTLNPQLMLEELTITALQTRA